MTDLRLIQGGMANTPPKGIAVADAIVRRESPDLSAAARQRDLLQQWKQDAHAATLAHRFESRRQHAIGTTLGYSVIVLTGCSVLLSALTAKSNIWAIIGAIISVLAMIFAGLQMFSRSGDRMTAAHATAADYASLKRRIEILLLKDNPPEKDVEVLERELHDAAKRCPIVTERLVRSARNEAGLPPAPSVMK